MQLSNPAGRFNDRTSLNPEGESDLTTTVLELIRSDNLKLKASTEVQLRHQIGMKSDVGETKIAEIRRDDLRAP